MNLVQQLLDGEGTKFGKVRIVVDEVNMACAYECRLDGAKSHTVLLDNLDQINGANATHTRLANENEYSADIVRALRYAARLIRDRKWGRSNG